MIKIPEHESNNYYRITQAIEFITLHIKDKPSSNAIAEAINLSPLHFQHLVMEWADATPEEFMHYLSIEYTKNVLRKKSPSWLDTTYSTENIKDGRAHDLLINIEEMTPNESKNGGEQLTINYCFSASPFGKLIAASTQKGLCHLLFEENENKAFRDLKQRFPNAHYYENSNQSLENALSIFQKKWHRLNTIKLHLKGTEFQLNVWKAALRIPMGQLLSYGNLAALIARPTASRAVGTAIGRNPIALLIPCHRVIQSSGKMGSYMWGSTRKLAINGWEACKINHKNHNDFT